MPVTIVRPFNTYGSRQSARAVIPAIIMQLLKGYRKVKLGSLSPMRDFNYVKDVCKGFLEIAVSDKTIGEEINIATQQDISIGDLAQELISMINPKAEVICDKKRIRPEKSEVKRLLGSNEKIRKLTNWEPQYSLRQGLAETIEWLRNNLDKYKADIYNV